MQFVNWPIRSKDKSRLDSFLAKLANGLDRKLSYVDVADLIFNYADSIVDVIVAAESVTNAETSGSVAA